MPSMVDAHRSGIGGLAKLGDGVRANSDARTQAGLGRGPNQSKKLINAAWTDTFPAQGATLDLDFANDRGFVRGIGQVMVTTLRLMALYQAMRIKVRWGIIC